MTSELFAGPDSLRVPGERSRLWCCVLALPLSLALIGYVFHDTFTPRSLLLLALGALVFVALSRGRFIGAGVRLGPAHFGDVYAVVEDCARLVGVPVPHVFLRDDLYVPVVAIGTGEPYALALSAYWIELYSPAELRFAIGRELAHVAAGHAKITSLMSASGRDNAIVSVTFGAWLRTIEYTADRVGLLCCGSLPTAMSAMAISAFQHVGRRVDVESFARQRRELEAEPGLRMGEWLASSPYVTNRIARLAEFERGATYRAWLARFAAGGTPVAPIRHPGGAARFAGPVRRCIAFALDFGIVSLLVPFSRGHGDSSDDAKENVTVSSAGAVRIAHGPVGGSKLDLDEMHARLSASHAPHGIVTGIDWIAAHVGSIVAAVVTSFSLAVLIVYAIVLVGLAGQTLGMMVCDVRVVDLREGRASLRGALARYAAGFASFALLVGFFAVFRRVQPFERWSRTRLVIGNALPERIASDA